MTLSHRLKSKVSRRKHDWVYLVIIFILISNILWLASDFINTKSQRDLYQEMYAKANQEAFNCKYKHIDTFKVGGDICVIYENRLNMDYLSICNVTYDDSRVIDNKFIYYGGRNSSHG